jgi:KDO2-lipid IV(A) lauroyltransferase
MLARLLGIITRWLLLAFSKLPLAVLHGIARFWAMVFHKILGYRKLVIETNLGFAFPNLSKEGKEKLLKKFYAYFLDTFLETLKIFSFTSQDLKERMKFTNPELLEELKANKQNIMYLVGHQGNWEWNIMSCAQNFELPAYCIYKPLSNQIFEKQMNQARSRLGTKMLPMKAVYATLGNNIEQPFVLMMGADQSPIRENKIYWEDFFGVNSAWFTGPEIIARKLNMALVFGEIIRVKRGYYEITLRVLNTEPNELSEGEIIRMYIDAVEANIKKQSYTYLWSHKRWKLTHNYAKS